MIWWLTKVCYLSRDQVAFIKPGTTPSIGVLGDEGQVDQDLTSFVRKVITEYGKSRRVVPFRQMISS
jgi:hypothetical protein